MKNCRITNVPSTLGAPKIGMTISGQCVLVSPRSSTSRNSGMIVTSLGTISPMRISPNTFSPRNRMRANAYPASEEKNIVPSVTSTAMYRLLKYCRANGKSVNAVLVVLPLRMTPGTASAGTRAPRWPAAATP